MLYKEFSGNYHRAYYPGYDSSYCKVSMSLFLYWSSAVYLSIALHADLELTKKTMLSLQVQTELHFLIFTKYYFFYKQNYYQF